MVSNGLAPDVSVIIPTRNRPDLLARAVQSTLGQTLERFELIVVDDGSDPPVANSLPRDPRIRVLRRHSSGGPAVARNHGAATAIGALIAFLDDDDVFLPRKLERSVACLSRHPRAGGLFHIVTFDAAPSRATTGKCDFLENPVPRMLQRQPPHVDGLVVRAQVHRRVRFDESFPAAEDLDYCLRLALDGPMLELDEVLSRHGPAATRISLVSLEARIAGRQMYHEKHAELFDNPVYEAYHRIRMGHLYRRAGRRARALREFAKAAKLQPRNRQAWTGSARTLIPLRLGARR